jgi:hypothetical protein
MGSSQNKSVEEADQRLLAFVQAIAPVLDEFLPK